MEQSKKQVSDTGNGDGNRPTPANEKQSTAARSKPSQPSTSTAASGTKPVSLPEALSLLQTLCFDLQSLGCRISILARNDRFYIVGAVPPDTGAMTISGGHIAINGVPVSEMDSK